MIVAAAVTANTFVRLPTQCVFIYFVRFTRQPVFVFSGGITRFVFKVLVVHLRGHWPYISVTYEHTNQFYDKGVGLYLLLEGYIGYCSVRGTSVAQWLRCCYKSAGRSHFLGVKAAGAYGLPPSCAVVTKSGNLNFLEPSGPLQACNGTALPFAVAYGLNTTYLF